MVYSGTGIESSLDYSRYRRRRSKKRFYWFFLVVIAVPILFFTYKSIGVKREAVKSIAITPTPTNIPTPTQAAQDSDLQQAVESALVGTKGTYGVAIINLKSSKSYFQNENTVFDSASLYKLWVMAVTYQKIESGEWKLTDIFSEKVEDLNKAFRIDDEAAEQKTGTITYTVSDSLNKMITISDNYAALLLAKRARLSTIQNFLNQYGLSNSKVGADGASPITTAKDTALFYNLLYSNKLPGSESMITLLKKQALNEKLPKYLPAYLPIAHKTGELSEFSHDAGIVYSTNGDYIIVVLSKSDSRELANERIANLSKAVYEFFEKN